jgi:purine-binding chemotaxis protein CheW
MQEANHRMAAAHQLVVFTMDEQRYALQLAAVERVVRMVEVTPLPQAPQIVLGVINVQGRIIPVVDLRRRFRIPARDVRLSDHLLIARTARRTVALALDAVTGIVEGSAPAVIMAEEILPGLEYVAGVMKVEEGLILIHDLEAFLSLEEEQTLDAALP